MVSSSTVRPFTDEAHIVSFYRLATETFSGPDEIDIRAARFRKQDESWPNFDPSQRRGVVAGERLFGGYIMHERRMCMGPARLSTACLAAVVTAPEARGQGIGRAMMEDAVAHATARGHALLLLDGAPGFYGRFGYTDVFDPTVMGIDVESIPNEPPAGYRVRPATVEDAPAMLELYRRHQGRYMGSFDWSIEHERLRLWLPIAGGHPPVVAEDASGRVQGYLYVEGNSKNASEVAADTEPALAALLHYHAPQAAAPPGEFPAIWWHLPPTSPTAYLLAGTLKTLPDTSGRSPLRVLSRQHRNEGWQARPADLQALLSGLEPLLQQRWQGSNRPFHGAISVRIGQDLSAWCLHDNGVDIRPGMSEMESEIVLIPQAFTQLVFAYRPAWWIAQQDGVRIPEDLLMVLEILFPMGGFNIAGSDAF